MKIHKLADAKEKGLIQLSTWLFDSGSERDILARMYNQVMKNEGRTAMVVYSPGGSRIALFVNNVIENKRNFRKFAN